MPKDTLSVEMMELMPISVEEANAMLLQTKLQLMTLDKKFGVADCDGGEQLCMWLPLTDMDLMMKSSSTSHRVAMKATLKAGQLSWKAAVKAMVALREEETGVKPLHLCVTFTKSGPKLVFAKGPEPRANTHSHGGPGHVIKVDPKLKGTAAKKPGKKVAKHVHPSP